MLKLRELMVGRTQNSAFRISAALVDLDGTVLGAEAAPGERVVRPTQRLLQDMHALAGITPAAAGQGADGQTQYEIKALSFAFERSAAALRIKDEQRNQSHAQLLATVESLQATERKLRARQEMLHMASTVSCVGAWQIDMPEAQLVWSPMRTRCDPQGPCIVSANDALEKSTGCTLDEVIGKSPSLLQGPATDRNELDRMRHALADHRPVSAELLNYTKSGTPYWIELEWVALMGAAAW